MSLWVYAAAAVLAGVGAMARVAITHAGELRVPGGPITMTAAINIVGAGLLGIVVGAGGDAVVVLLGVGLLGGFTTFSTWMVEVDGLQRVGRYGAAGIAIGLPILLGLAAYAVTRAVR